MNFNIGDDVLLLKPLRPGPAKVVAKIGAGSRPHADDIKLWFECTEDDKVFRVESRPIKVDRYIYFKDQMDIMLKYQIILIANIW